LFWHNALLIASTGMDKVNAANGDIEKHKPQLAGVLPKNFNFFTRTLLKELLKKVSEIPATTDYDAFGCNCEYFLAQSPLDMRRFHHVWIQLVVWRGTSNVLRIINP
jgi:hypothetical protein